MTRATNSRVAGFTFLAYIVVGIISMMLHGKAVKGDDIVAQLTSINLHRSYLQAALVLDLLCAFAAIVLGVTLYALTREQDPHLAMLGLVCRGAEGIVAGVSVQASVGLLWVAKAVASNDSNTEATNAIGSYLLGVHWSPLVAATFFAVGSTAFSWLFLRGRMIPVWMAWSGVISSALLVVALPLQLGGFLPGSVVQFLWIPMAAFEIPLAVWLLVKGAAPPRGAIA
jgi:hypothetical protein